MDVAKLLHLNNEKQAILLQLSVVCVAAILGRFLLISDYDQAFAVRLYSVIRFESVIHEFDPYFNYRTTRFMTENGFYQFHDWFDDMAWYPLGRIIGGTIYPGKFEILKIYHRSYDDIVFYILTTSCHKCYHGYTKHMCIFGTFVFKVRL